MSGDRDDDILTPHGPGGWLSFWLDDLEGGPALCVSDGELWAVLALWRPAPGSVCPVWDFGPMRRLGLGEALAGGVAALKAPADMPKRTQLPALCTLDRWLERRNAWRVYGAAPGDFVRPAGLPAAEILQAPQPFRITHGFKADPAGPHLLPDPGLTEEERRVMFGDPDAPKPQGVIVVGKDYAAGELRRALTDYPDPGAGLKAPPSNPHAVPAELISVVTKPANPPGVEAAALSTVRQPAPDPQGGGADSWLLVVTDVGLTDFEKGRSVSRRESARVVGLLTDDMMARREFGLAEYGTPVMTRNGRNHLLDAYQEVLDGCVYLRADATGKGWQAGLIYRRLLQVAFDLRAMLDRAGVKNGDAERSGDSGANRGGPDQDSAPGPVEP